MPAIPLVATSSSSVATATAGEVVSVAILLYVLYQQRQIRVLKTKLVLPLILAVLGLSSMLGDLKVHPLSASQATVLVGLFVGDAVGLGALRAFTVRLWREGGQIFRQGRWLTLGLWLVGVAVHEGVLAAAHFDSSSLLLYVGLTLGAQRLVLGARARRPNQVAEGRPTAEEAGRHPPTLGRR